uniref:KIX domain-containing protein n=1 Tax=Caenorhabditis tropicalis TaxID=1561998 RepID=A0A1I7TA92_9PELO
MQHNQELEEIASLPMVEDFVGDLTQFRSPKLREHLVRKLIEAIKPDGSNENAPQVELEEYCQSTEEYISKSSTDYLDYYSKMEYKLRVIQQEFDSGRDHPAWLFALFNKNPLAQGSSAKVFEKEWQRSITPQIRDHLRTCLRMALLYEDNGLEDTATWNLVENLEAGYYQSSDSRTEYYNIVAMKILEALSKTGKRLDEVAITKVKYELPKFKIFRKQARQTPLIVKKSAWADHPMFAKYVGCPSQITNEGVTSAAEAFGRRDRRSDFQKVCVQGGKRALRLRRFQRALFPNSVKKIESIKREVTDWPSWFINGFSGYFFMPGPHSPKDHSTKKWQNKITETMRRYFKKILKEAISPPCDSVVNRDYLKDLQEYSDGIEEKLFETANGRDEFYKMVIDEQGKLKKKKEENLKKAAKRYTKHVSLSRLEMGTYNSLWRIGGEFEDEEEEESSDDDEEEEEPAPKKSSTKRKAKVESSDEEDEEEEKKPVLRRRKAKKESSDDEEEEDVASKNLKSKRDSVKRQNSQRKKKDDSDEDTDDESSEDEKPKKRQKPKYKSESDDSEDSEKAKSKKSKKSKPVLSKKKRRNSDSDEEIAEKKKSKKRSSDEESDEDSEEEKSKKSQKKQKASTSVTKKRKRQDSSYEEESSDDSSDSEEDKRKPKKSQKQQKASTSVTKKKQRQDSSEEDKSSDDSDSEEDKRKSEKSKKSKRKCNSDSEEESSDDSSDSEDEKKAKSKRSKRKIKANKRNRSSDSEEESSDESEDEKKKRKKSKSYKKKRNFSSDDDSEEEKLSKRTKKNYESSDDEEVVAKKKASKKRFEDSDDDSEEEKKSKIRRSKRNDKVEQPKKKRRPAIPRGFKWGTFKETDSDESDDYKSPPSDEEFHCSNRKYLLPKP